jgi:DNA-binding transcriptional LysR family regulator
MAAQAMTILDQEQLLAGEIIAVHHLVMAKGMVARHRYDDWMIDAEELVGLAHNAHEPLSGPLRFGVIPTVGPYVLPSLLPRLGTALPKLKLYVREAQTSALLDKLAGGELDILLVAIPYELGDVEAMEIAKDASAGRARRSPSPRASASRGDGCAQPV